MTRQQETPDEQEQVIQRFRETYGDFSARYIADRILDGTLHFTTVARLMRGEYSGELETDTVDALRNALEGGDE